MDYIALGLGAVTMLIGVIAGAALATTSKDDAKGDRHDS